LTLKLGAANLLLAIGKISSHRQRWPRPLSGAILILQALLVVPDYLRFSKNDPDDQRRKSLDSGEIPAAAWALRLTLKRWRWIRMKWIDFGQFGIHRETLENAG